VRWPSHHQGAGKALEQRASEGSAVVAMQMKTSSGSVDGEEYAPDEDLQYMKGYGIEKSPTADT